MTLTEIQDLLAPSLLRVDPLLLRLEDSAQTGLESFLDDLLAWSAGQRGFVEAGHSYLREQRFEQAAQCLLKRPDAKLQRELEQRWQEWLQQQKAYSGQMEARAESIEKLSGAGLPAGRLKDVRALLQQAWSKLETLPTGEGPGLCQTLAGLELQLRQELDAELLLVKEELNEFEAQIAHRTEQERQRLLNAKRRVDRLLDDLLLNPQLSPEALERIQRESSRAYRNQQETRIEEYIDLLTRMQRGENITLTEEAAAAAPTAQPVTPRTAPPLSMARTFQTDQMSKLARRLLEERTEAAEVPPIAEAVSEAFHSWDWNPQRFRNTSASAREALRQNEKDDMVLGAFLLSEARTALLGKRFEQSRVLFADSFRWASHGQTPAYRSASQLAASGVLVTLTLPYLPDEEREQVLYPDNLAALFRKEAFPLVQLEALSLMTDLASVLVRMGMPAAEAFFEEYLLQFLEERLGAASDFVVGILSELVELPAQALNLLVKILPRLGVPTANFPELLQDGRSASRSPPLPSSIRELSDWFDRLADTHGLASFAADELKNIARRMELPQEKSQKPLGIRLLTPRIPALMKARLVLELSLSDEVLQPIRYLQTRASLLDKQEKSLEKSIYPPSVIAVRPGERRELVIPLARTDDGILRADRLQLNHLTIDEEGVSRPVEARLSSFGVVVERPAKLSPLNPYDVGPGTQRQQDIFGRAPIIERIRAKLMGASQDNSVLVLGERRIGKTTLLNAIEQDEEIRRRYQFIVRLDIQSAKYETSAERFFLHEFIAPIHRQLASSVTRLPPVPDLQKSGSAYAAFREFLERVDQLLAATHKRMLLVIDELDEFLLNVEQQRLPDKLNMQAVSAIRAAINASKQISFIFAGVTGVLRRHTRGPEDRLFRLFLEEELLPLDERASRELITKPAQKFYDVTPAAAERIFLETGGQPYLLKYVCRLLFEDMVRNQVQIVTQTDVDDLLREKVVPKASAFDYLHIPDSADFERVKAIAALQYRRNFVLMSDVRKYLQRAGKETSMAEIREHLTRMSHQWPMVVANSGGAVPRFKIPIGLYASHLRYKMEEHLQSSLVLRTRR